MFSKNFFLTIDCFFRRLLPDCIAPTLHREAMPAGTTVFTRSNYTRFEHKHYAWGFVPMITGEPVAIRTHAHYGSFGRMYTNQREILMDPAEMRSLAYTLLAAANSIDGRHKGERRKASRKRVPEFTA